MVDEQIPGDVKQPRSAILQRTERLTLTDCSQKNVLQQVVGFILVASAMAQETRKLGFMLLPSLENAVHVALRRLGRTTPLGDRARACSSAT
jgi:hypothetical protein